MNWIFSCLASAGLIVSTVVAASNAGAAPPKADVSNDSITCSTITGTAKFNPPLDQIGLNELDIKINGKLAGCVDNTNGAVLIDSGTVSGTITVPTSFCPDLIGTSPATGTLTYKWKANKTTPIEQTKSTQVVNSFTGDLFTPGAPLGSASYVTLSVATVSVSGAFTGGDAGATSSIVIATSQNFGQVQSQCGSNAGAKLVNFGIGTVTLQ